MTRETSSETVICQSVVARDTGAETVSCQSVVARDTGQETVSCRSAGNSPTGVSQGAEVRAGGSGESFTNHGFLAVFYLKHLVWFFNCKYTKVLRLKYEIYLHLFVFLSILSYTY